MVFSSMTFLFLFLPLVMVLYYAVPPLRVKNVILLVASLVFYAWGEPIYIILMIYEIVVNYISGLLMEKNEKHKKEILIFTIVIDLGILFFFKYYGFFIRNLNSIFNVNLKIHQLALPIGISFYTFQTLSYIIDLYRGKFKAQKNIFDFALYISMFPQLIAGPIVRYEDIYPALAERKHSLELLGKGSIRFVVGLSKKVILANSIGAVFDSVHALSGMPSAMTAWTGALAYTFQIYFDFSGYSDMAIGLGNMFGFSFNENFNEPYSAATVTDFWRRWHISLGAWFREYVYIPLGGNRTSTAKHIRNIMIVWLLTGFWHGAQWTFVLWGLYYGILLLVDKYLINRKGKGIPSFVTRPFTIIIIIMGWVIFSAGSVKEAWDTITCMWGRSHVFMDNKAIHLLRTNGIMMGLCLFFSLPLPRFLCKKMEKNISGRVIIGAFALGMMAICLLYLVTQNYNPFLYFQF